MNSEHYVLVPDEQAAIRYLSAPDQRPVDFELQHSESLTDKVKQWFSSHNIFRRTNKERVREFDSQVMAYEQQVDTDEQAKQLASTVLNEDQNFNLEMFMEANDGKFSRGYEVISHAYDFADTEETRERLSDYREQLTQAMNLSFLERATGIERSVILDQVRDTEGHLNPEWLSQRASRVRSLLEFQLGDGIDYPAYVDSLPSDKPVQGSVADKTARRLVALAPISEPESKKIVDSERKAAQVSYRLLDIDTAHNFEDMGKAIKAATSQIRAAEITDIRPAVMSRSMHGQKQWQEKLQLLESYGYETNLNVAEVQQAVREIKSGIAASEGLNAQEVRTVDDEVRLDLQSQIDAMRADIDRRFAEAQVNQERTRRNFREYFQPHSRKVKLAVAAVLVAGTVAACAYLNNQNQDSVANDRPVPVVSPLDEPTFADAQLDSGSWFSNLGVRLQHLWSDLLNPEPKEQVEEIESKVVEPVVESLHEVGSSIEDLTHTVTVSAPTWLALQEQVQDLTSENAQLRVTLTATNEQLLETNQSLQEQLQAERELNEIRENQVHANTQRIEALEAEVARYKSELTVDISPEDEWESQIPDYVPRESTVHTVQAGEYLTRIATEYYGFDTGELGYLLCELNEIRNCNQLRIGQELVIPPLEVVEKQYPQYTKFIPWYTGVQNH